MNSKLLLISLFTILIGFSSCNKNNDADEYQPVTPLPLIKTMTVINKLDGLTHVFSFEYDELNRVTNVQVDGELYEKYSYLNDTLISRELFSSNSVFEIDSVKLNGQGLVVSDSRRLFLIYQYDDDMRHFYDGNAQYNSDGYIFSIGSSYGGYHATYKIEDGNTIETAVSQRIPILEDESIFRDSLIQTYNYQYFTTTTNTIGNENLGMAWKGKQNKNLVSEITIIRANSQASTSPKMTYTYKYDSQRRVIKKTSISDNGESVRTYTYY